MKKWIIIAIICIVLLAVFIVVLKYVFKKNRRKNIMNSIDRLGIEKNMIMSSSLITELEKAKKLVNNKKTEKEVEGWQERFDTLEKKDMSKLTDALVDIETLCINKAYDAEVSISL